MMGTVLDFSRWPKIRSAAAFAIALGLLSAAGCSAHNSSASNGGGVVIPSSPEAAAVANSQSQEPKYDKDEDRTLKCEQLVRNPPGIEEIRNTPQVGIESREIRAERNADSYRWVVYRSKGSATDGWHAQKSLDKL